MSARIPLVLGIGAAAWIALLGGCDEDRPSGHCAAWCEIAVSAELDELEGLGCDLTDDPEEFAAGCRETCDETMSGLAGRPGDVRDCIECIDGELGDSPTHAELQSALNGPCDGPCFEEGMVEFWDEFWGDWSFYDFDYECN